MNSKHTRAPARRSASASKTATAAVAPSQWIVCVLKEMQQVNAAMQARYGRPRALQNDDSLS